MVTTIGLFDRIPEPENTEHILIVGHGAFKQIYSAAYTNRENTLLQWKLVGTE